MQTSNNKYNNFSTKFILDNIDKLLVYAGLTMCLLDQFFLSNGFTWIDAVATLMLSTGAVIALRCDRGADQQLYLQFGIVLLVAMYLILWYFAGGSG